VGTRPTEMSMAISCQGCGLAYVGGRGASGVFAQRRRIADPRHWRLLRDVRRFQKAALSLVRHLPDSPETYGEFLRREGFGSRFVQHYALPIVACVWSSGSRDALDYPAAYLFAFLRHHGFLTLGDAPQWQVVDGGSRTYVDRIRATLPDVRTGSDVVSVARKADCVVLTDDRGHESRFDQVILAGHADESLRILSDPTDEEFEVLGAFNYTRNLTQLHTDDTALSPHRAERASWNFRMEHCDESTEEVQVSYWMNRLQHHPESAPLVVTLNGARRVEPTSVFATMEYAHPLYTQDAVAAQRRLPGLNGDRTAFAGAYHGWGFHEDGCRSGVAAAEHFGAVW
ncbi:MAG TPA: FAD-dependent oxidoreductase, partial [Nocardioidaceae bacterium]|nr:FAD-dependent oxidoreductase [Nocardioidaceae bacterium]